MYIRYYTAATTEDRVTLWDLRFVLSCRSLPIDMAGFAVNVNLVLKHRDAVIGKNKNGKASLPGYLEPDFLEQMCTRETVECRGQKEVWICGAL